MESISVLTGQHVTIEYKSASIVDRMLALLVDGFIQCAYVFAIIFTAISLESSGIMKEDISIVLAIIFLLPFFTYHFLFESLWGGQTPGKKVMNIRVTNEDGSATGVGSYFLRWLIRPIDSIFMGGVGAIFILATEKNQRLGDLAAGTVVVKTQPKQQRIQEEYYTFNPNYQVQYPQASNLTKGQILFIQKALGTPLKTNEYRENEEINELALKIRQMLNITTQGGDRNFLENIVRDYYYYDSLGV